MKQVPISSSIAAATLVAMTVAYTSMSFARQAIESRQTIIDSVQHYLEQQLKHRSGRHDIKIGHLDSRLRLPACQEPLLVSQTSGHATIGKRNLMVRCKKQKKPWQIYVSAQVAEYQQVLVSHRYLPRNRAIRSEDLRHEEKNIATLHRGYFRNPEAIIGLIVKRPLRAGQVISENALRPPLLVKRGQKVTIIAKRQGLAVRMTGRALSDGALGTSIRVRNERSKRVIEGRVSAQGIVQASL